MYASSTITTDGFAACAASYSARTVSRGTALPVGLLGVVMKTTSGLFSAITQATALAALEHTDTLLKYVEQLKSERDRLVSELRALGYDVTESDANFVQFGRFEDSRTAWQQILDRGVLVRDNGVPGWLRVTAGTPEENDAFLDAVREVKKELDA